MQRRRLASVVAAFACFCSLAAARAQDARTSQSRPATDPRARAADHLRAALERRRPIDLDDVVAELETPDRLRREDAAAYVDALLELTSIESVRLQLEEMRARRDRYEKTGVREYGFNRDAALDIRQELRFSIEDASIPPDAVEALRPAVRLMRSNVADEVAAGFQIVRKVRSVAADDLVREAATLFPGRRAMLVDVLFEIGKRGLTDQTPLVRECRAHPARAVRAAARDAARSLGLTDLAASEPAAAFTARQESALRRIAAATDPIVPSNTRWVRIDPRPAAPTPPKSGAPAAALDDFPSYTPYLDDVVRFGRVVDETSTSLTVVDWRGVVVVFRASNPRLAAATAEDAVDELLRARMRRNPGRPVSIHDPPNWLLFQVAYDEFEAMTRFEETEPTTADALVGAWAFVAGDTTTAARCMFPLLEAQDDEDAMFGSIRDALATGIEERMLKEFTETGDYVEAIRLARRLMSPTFAGFKHQGLARELAAQLKRRGDDFHRLRLPSRDEWAARRRNLTRVEEVAFLAARLRLIACNQREMPGGCDYSNDFQSESGDAATEPFVVASERDRAINPFNELWAMGLAPFEAVDLLPTLESDDFVRGFDRERFMPQRPRTLHRAAFAAGLVLNRVLGAGVVRFELLTPERAEERAKHVADLRARLEAMR
jgi:hypothetical protein